MTAEVLHDTIVQVTGVPTRFDSVAFPGGDVQKTDFYPLGTRAVQLYDAAVQSYFLQAFGRNPRRIVCECERSGEPTDVNVIAYRPGGVVAPDPVRGRAPADLGEAAVDQTLGAPLGSSLTLGGEPLVDHGVDVDARPCDEKAAVDLPIQGQCEPPDDDVWFVRMKHAGIDSLGMHLEAVTPQVRARIKEMRCIAVPELVRR